MQLCKLGDQQPSLSHVEQDLGVLCMGLLLASWRYSSAKLGVVDPGGRHNASTTDNTGCSGGEKGAAKLGYGLAYP